MKSLIWCFVLSLLIGVRASCDAAVDFTSEVQPIFTANCVSCHGSSGAANMNLSAGSAYANLVNVNATTATGKRVVPGDVANSVLASKMTHMVALSTANQDTIKAWITEGALETPGSGGNSAPVISSAASATPNPVEAGQSVALSVSATDANSDPLTYAWNFGDGTAGDGASVTHTYAAAGTYSATVTVSDGKGSVQSTASVTVSAGPITAITLSKVGGKTTFGEVEKDQALAMGIIPGLAQGFDSTNATVSVSIGGATANFTLDDKGKGVDGMHQFKLKLKKTKGVFAGGDAPFQIRLKKGTFESLWQDEGLTPTAELKNSPINMVVIITLNGTTYAGTYQALATTVVGKKASFK